MSFNDFIHILKKWLPSCKYLLKLNNFYGAIIKGRANPDSKVHGAYMGPTWVLSTPGGSHVGLMNLAIWEFLELYWDHGVANQWRPGFYTACIYCYQWQSEGDGRLQLGLWQISRWYTVLIQMLYVAFPVTVLNINNWKYLGEQSDIGQHCGCWWPGAKEILHMAQQLWWHVQNFVAIWDPANEWHGN